MKKSSSFKKFVSLSFVVHVVVLGGLFLFEKEDILNSEVKSVSIDLLMNQAPIKITSASKDIQKNPKYQPKNQIVEQSENSVNEKERVDARYLSAKNQSVTKETIAANKGQFQNLKESTKVQLKIGDGKAKSLGPSPAKETQPKITKSEQINKNLFEGFNPTAAHEQKKKNISNGGSDAPLGKGLGQSDREMNVGADASRTNDYLKEVDNGLETMLNTREFKYYSYYNRIRRQLTQHWESRVREKLTKMFREGRAPASSGQDRMTKLMIHLDNNGTLVKIQVLFDSGVRDLDDAAIDAFRAAAPFPNPPKGIIENDGTVKIRWDFVLES
jgi:protein TonB